MNRRVIYETVRQHLLTQRAKSQTGGDCLYRGPNGLKCAIGCLIPDEVYKPDMESLDVMGMLKLWPNHPFSDIRDLFLRDLQCIHDNLEPEYWTSALDDFAHRYNL